VILRRITIIRNGSLVKRHFRQNKITSTFWLSIKNILILFLFFSFFSFLAALNPFYSENILIFPTSLTSNLGLNEHLPLIIHVQNPLPLSRSSHKVTNQMRHGVAADTQTGPILKKILSCHCKNFSTCREHQRPEIVPSKGSKIGWNATPKKSYKIAHYHQETMLCSNPSLSYAMSTSKTLHEATVWAKEFRLQHT